MVKVKCKQRDPKDLKKWIEKEFYLDGYIKENLDLGVKQLRKDFDQVWFMDGGEGDGKTTVAITFAYYVNPEETRHTLIDRICNNIEEAEDKILTAKKYEAIVIDEGYGGMSSSGSNSRINRLLQRRFTEIRAKNLFIFILAPSFMDIQRYFAIWRTRCLLHIYTQGDKRGFAAFFSSRKKKKLYIIGRKNFYDYSCVAPDFIFRFTDPIKKTPYLIDDSEYQKRKRKKNLDKPHESTISEKKREADLWRKVMSRTYDCEPPLLDKQKAFLIDLSTRSINSLNKEIKELQEMPKESEDIGEMKDVKYTNILTSQGGSSKKEIAPSINV